MSILEQVATLVCVLSVPMLYNYLQHMQSIMQNEVSTCLTFLDIYVTFQRHICYL